MPPESPNRYKTPSPKRKGGFGTSPMNIDSERQKNLRPQGFSNLDGSLHHQRLSASFLLPKTPSKRSDSKEEAAFQPQPRDSLQREKISPEEFSKKVYTRFENFVRKRDEKMKQLSQTEKRTKVSVTDFENKVLTRFDQYSKESQKLKEKLKNERIKEERGSKSQRKKVTVDDFQQMTLSRFEKYDKMAKARMEKLAEEAKNAPGKPIEGIGSPPSFKVKHITPSHSQLQVSDGKEKKKVVSRIGSQLAEKFDEFSKEKLRKRNSERQRQMEIEAKREMNECSFSPNINKRKSPSRSPERHYEDLERWKNDSEARKISKRLEMVTKEEENTFHPKLSNHSITIVVKSFWFFGNFSGVLGWVE